MVVQCLSGCAHYVDPAEPKLMPHAVHDKATGQVVTQAVISALVAKDRGAGGQHLHVLARCGGNGAAGAWLSVRTGRRCYNAPGRLPGRSLLSLTGLIAPGAKGLREMSGRGSGTRHRQKDIPYEPGRLV